MACSSGVKLTPKSWLKSLPCEDTHLNCQPMRWRKRSISASGARETATNVTSRCARCTFMPSVWSAMKEQLGQPCSQPGAEHEVLHQQLAAALEQVGERARPSGVSKT